MELTENYSDDLPSPSGENELCILHMLVPLEARTRGKLAALASSLSFRDYVTILLYGAKPISDKRPE